MAPAGLGTLGFFGTSTDETAWCPLLVSSYHVLFAHGAQTGDAIYQPTLTATEDGYVLREDELCPIGMLRPGGVEEHHCYAYPGEKAREYFVDCGTVELSPDFRYRFRSVFPGPVSLGKRRLRGIRRLAASDARGARGVQVFKWGSTTGLTQGRVLDTAATVTVGGRRRTNVILVRGDREDFVQRGDSGAVLVNQRLEVVGLVWGRSDTDRGLAFACHIHPVLDCLSVSLVTFEPRERERRLTTEGTAS